jgi:hypothetical protein
LYPGACGKRIREEKERKGKRREEERISSDSFAFIPFIFGNSR